MKENEMVFGIRAVIEAIQADKEIDKILVKRELQGDLSRELFEVLKGRDILQNLMHHVIAEIARIIVRGHATGGNRLDIIEKSSLYAPA